MNKAVLYLTRKKIYLKHGSDHSEIELNSKIDAVLLKKVIDDIENKIGKLKLTIVLGSEFVYTVAFEKEDKEVPQQEIFEEAKRTIPINITEKNFFWRSTMYKNKKVIQGMAVEENVIQMLGAISRESGHEVLALYPIELLISDYFKTLPVPVLIVWEGYENLILSLYKGCTFMSFSYESLNKKTIDEAIENTIKVNGSPLSTIIYVGSSPDSINQLPVGTEKLNFDIAELILAGKFAGLRDNVMHLILSDGSDVSRGRQVQTVSKENSSKIPLRKVSVAAGVILLTGLVLVGANKLNTSQKTEVARSDTSEDPISKTTISNALEPTIPIENIDIYSYSVKVVNGSGKAGEAAKVKEILTQAGFGKIEVGNADTFSYERSEVRVREGLQGDVFTPIKASLGDYVVVLGEPLAKDAVEDVLIIVALP